LRQKDIPVFILSEEDLILISEVIGEALENAVNSVKKTLDLEVNVTL